MAYDDSRDRLYVADTRSHNIKAFDKDGKFLFTIGKRGSGDGEFNFPSYVAVDKNGRLYVTDSFNFRVADIRRRWKVPEKIRQRGRCLRFFFKAGRHRRGLGRPYICD